MPKDLTGKTLRTWSDDIDPASIPDSVLFAEVGRRNNAKRKRHAGGRPRSKDLCLCGRMTRSRARLRGHVCDESTPKWRARETLSTIVKDMRRELRLTQQGLAAQMNKASITVAKWETSTPPTGQSLIDLRNFAQQKGMSEFAALFEAAMNDSTPPWDSIAPAATTFPEADTHAGSATKSRRRA